MATPDADATAGEEEPSRDRKMTLAGHLRELRKRLMIAAIALIVGMIVSFILTDYVIAFLVQPIELVFEQLDDEFNRLAYTSITGPFDMRLRISFAIGLVISAPVWLWQIWAFVMPGLKKKERWYTVGFMSAAIPLFFGGCAVGLMVLPNIIMIMSSFVPEDALASQIYEASTYYAFVFRLIIVVGVAFVLPVFLVALNLAGVLSGKSILKGWRVGLIVTLVFGMLASAPTDIVTMLVLAAILFALYMAAGVVSLLFDRRRRKRNPDTFVEV